MSQCGSPQFAFGNQVTLTVGFTTVASGTPVDPTDVLLRLQFGGFSPTQVSFTSGQVLRTGVGQYAYYFTPVSGGYWQYAWEGIGTVLASTPNGSFFVTTNLFG